MEVSNLKHLAMILDGNRRWGKARGIKMSVDFYIQSGLLGLDIAKAVFSRGIPHLTIWIGSVSNLTERPAMEIAALNKAYAKFFADEENLQFAHENKIQIECIGRWRELLKPETVKAIEKTVAETAQHADSGRLLTVLIGYDGTEERGAALESVLLYNPEFLPDDSSSAGKLHSFADLLRKNSWTGHLPDIDLIIRTGSGADPHNSAGFMSMLADNAQFTFLETLWPDFTAEMLGEILDNFSRRERRLGK
ncbi:MAG: undecaprenyl diphosphate synthase family protein [Candidatus Nomurabacteria bacterium]|jgi:undecaprenyl diphosphate synthase|nr:undecaprenyl diphosphate synthase family protein [Candidatus Nomurabacteria bacterium]